MAGFIISYVPQVELVNEVEKVDTVATVENVNQVETVRQVDNVGNVENVQNVENVEWVETVDEVNTVHDVRKLPHPYFPLKKYNYQTGGMTHVTPTQNLYQAVFVPEYDCEFKGVHLTFSAYNLEDTYDIMVGARYVVRGSHVKEMSEYRMFETYEVVPAGTPIVIHFHNNSGLEKYMMYDVITLIDEKSMAYPTVLNWNFYWEDLLLPIDEQDTGTVIVNQPNYVNLDSTIETFELDVINLLTQEKIATITGNEHSVSSDFPEHPYFGRVNVIAIIDVRWHQKSIEIVFKNINDTGTAEGHPVEMGIRGRVVNSITGGI